MGFDNNPNTRCKTEIKEKRARTGSSNVQNERLGDYCQIPIIDETCVTFKSNVSQDLPENPYKSVITVDQNPNLRLSLEEFYTEMPDNPAPYLPTNNATHSQYMSKV